MSGPGPERTAAIAAKVEAFVLQKTGLSPLGALACNTAAADEGNMYLLAVESMQACR